MLIHEIVVVPGAGHLGPGDYDRGYTTERLAEVDLVDNYVYGMLDEFDQAGIRNRILPTRKAPGVSAEDRARDIFPNSLILHCKVGHDSAAKRGRVLTANMSTVGFNNGEANGLAKEVGEVLAHWGKLYAFKHRGGGVVVNSTDPLLSIPGTWGLRLEPFRINGPDAEIYARFLTQLGRDIGRFIADFCRARKDSAAVIPTTIAEAKNRIML